MKNNRWQAPADIKQKLSELSLREKIHMMDGDISFERGIKALLEEDYYHTDPFPAGVLSEHNIEGIKFIDGPRGVVLHGGATSFPVPMARGASFDPALERAIGKAIGIEHRILGGNLFGGVCINLLRHPGWGRAQETYGEDPELLAQMGVALTQGVQEHVMACVKHFAVNSMENARFKVDVKADASKLHECYLPHFKRVVQEAKVASVMSAYNALNGEWCGQSPWLLNTVLKNTWGFEGFVLTDFIFGMRDAKAAALAGQDLEMPFQMHYARFLEDLVKSGEVPESVIDDACCRLLYQQSKYADIPSMDKQALGCDAHKKLAREAAARSFVLLKNKEVEKGRCILPLDPAQSIALIGKLANTPNLGDHGSSDGRPDYVITPLEGLRAQLGNSPKLQYDAGDNIEQACSLAEGCDVAVLVVGYTAEDEGEYIAPISLEPFADGIKPPGLLNRLFKIKALRPLWRKLAAWAAQRQRNNRDYDNNPSFGRGGDRRNLGLSPSDEALIEAVSAINPNTIVLVMAGSAVLMEQWKDKVAGIMMIWYPGMEGGYALADVLLGKRSPSGRLPFSIPTDASHLPAFDPDATSADYNDLHGYQRLHAQANQAAFPFGFGLTYGKTKWSDSVINQSTFTHEELIELSVQVSNESSLASYETALLFIRAKSIRTQSEELAHPPIELKAFNTQLIEAKTSTQISVTLPASRIEYYVAEKDDLMYKPGIYEIALCRHAQDKECNWHQVNLI